VMRLRGELLLNLPEAIRSGVIYDDDVRTMKMMMTKMMMMMMIQWAAYG